MQPNFEVPIFYAGAKVFNDRNLSTGKPIAEKSPIFVSTGETKLFLLSFFDFFLTGEVR